MVQDLVILPDRYGVLRLPPEDPLPMWVEGSRFWSITRTSSELSVVADWMILSEIPGVFGPWLAIQVAGALDFEQVGVLQSLCKPLSDSGVSVFAISTFDTDYLLIQEHQISLAITALTRAGHRLPPNPCSG